MEFRCLCWNVILRLAAPPVRPDEAPEETRSRTSSSGLLPAASQSTSKQRATAISAVSNVLASHLVSAFPRPGGEADLATAEVALAGRSVRHEALVHEQTVDYALNVSGSGDSDNDSTSAAVRCLVVSCMNCGEFVFAEPVMLGIGSSSDPSNATGVLVASQSGFASAKPPTGLGQLRARIFGFAKSSDGESSASDRAASPVADGSIASVPRSAGIVVLNARIPQYASFAEAAAVLEARDEASDTPAFVWSPTFEIFLQDSEAGANTLIECPEEGDEPAFSSFSQLNEQLEESLAVASTAMEEAIEEYRRQQHEKFASQQHAAYRDRKLLWQRMCEIHVDDWAVAQSVADSAEDVNAEGPRMILAADEQGQQSSAIAGVDNITLHEDYDGRQETAEASPIPAKNDMVTVPPERATPDNAQFAAINVQPKPTVDSTADNDNIEIGGNAIKSGMDSSLGEIFALDDGGVDDTAVAKKFLQDAEDTEDSEGAAGQDSRVREGQLGRYLKAEARRSGVWDKFEDDKSGAAHSHGSTDQLSPVDLTGSSVPVQIPSMARRRMESRQATNDPDVALSLKLLRGEDVLSSRSSTNVRSRAGSAHGNAGGREHAVTSGFGEGNGELPDVDADADSELLSRSFAVPQSMNRRRRATQH